MFNTVFAKIMFLFMAIILISLLATGVVMTQTIKNAYIEDSRDQMLRIADDVCTLMSWHENGIINATRTRNEIIIKAKSNNQIIWVINNDGTVWIATENITIEEIQMYYDDMINTLVKEQKPVWMLHEQDDFFNTPMITVATPFYYDNSLEAFVFVHTRVSELNDSLMTIFRQILLSATISALLANILTFLFTRNLLKPLRVVNSATRQLAKGNFNINIQIHSKDEISELADTFNSVSQDLKKNEQTRESFVANVSHELRSPLTSIQGLVQGVVDGTINTEDQKHYLEVVLGETKRLNLLITDLLDLAKLDSGQFPIKLQRIEINEFIRRALITFEKKIEAKKLEVYVEFDAEKAYVLADENRITQVLLNLMDNAIKFVNEGGRLSIYTKVTAASVFININNSGDIIEKGDIPYLFDRFYKTDKSHNRAKEGTGIGLSLVKKILKEHHQKIWVTSNKKDGTTFTFTLKKD